MKTPLTFRFMYQGLLLAIVCMVGAQTYGAKALRPSNLVVGNNVNIISSACDCASEDCCQITTPLLEELGGMLADDFASTWTILEEILNNSLTCTEVVISFTELTTTVTECCNTTFSLLIELNETITADFMSTWTILTELSDTLTACCATTFSSLTQLEENVNECCTLTFSSLNDLLITISNDFISTWTILADISDSATICCASTFSTLDELRTSVTECCALTTSVVADLSVTLAEGFVATWTILDSLAQATCSRITLTEAQVIDGAGSYCLGADIVGTLTIEASNVTLDLNGYTIGEDVNGIVIAAGFESIEIFNGRIRNTFNEGILINDASSAIRLHDLSLVDCGTLGTSFAIQVAGAAGRVQGCEFARLHIETAPGGISFINTDNALVKDCSIIECLNVGGPTRGLEINSTGVSAESIELEGCLVSSVSSEGQFVYGVFANNIDGFICRDCTVQEITAPALGIGIFVQSTQGALIEKCAVQTMTGNSLTGIWCGSTTEYIIQNCDVIGLSSTVGGDTRGVYLSNANGGVVDAVNCVALASGGTGASGLRTLDSTEIVIKNCNFVDISGSADSPAYGIALGNGSAIMLDNCSINMIVAEGRAAGIIVDSGVVFSDLVCTNCSINNVSITVDDITHTAYGLGLFGTVSSVFCQNCTINNIIAPDGFFGDTDGLFIGANVTNASLDECTAITIPAGFARGFSIAATSGALLHNCRASFIGGIGIEVRAGVANSVVENCRADRSTTGISNSSDSTNKFINCIAANNVTNYFGIVAPSTVSTLGSVTYFAGTNISA